MTKTRRVTLAIGSILFTVIMTTIFLDKMGKMRWFWPYDDAVFGGGILFGVIGAVLLKAAVEPIERRYLDRVEREDGEQ